MPVFVEVVQPVGVADFPGVRVLQHGEFQRKSIPLVGEDDPGGFRDLLVQDIVFPGRIEVHLFVQDGEFR